MAKYSTIILVKMLTLWNYIVHIYKKTTTLFSNFISHISDFFCGHHDTWLFMAGHTIPISLNNINNTIPTTWIYDNNINKLSVCIDNSSINCKLSWLSAKLRIIDEDGSAEYNIDNFIENLVVSTTDNIAPTLYMIYMCWCIHTKHWFSLHNTVEFHIIDDMGEDVILSIEDHNRCLFIRHNMIYVTVDNEVIVESNSDYLHLESEKKTD